MGNSPDFPVHKTWYSPPPVLLAQNYFLMLPQGQDWET
jgi:hypothetical protein